MPSPNLYGKLIEKKIDSNSLYETQLHVFTIFASLIGTLLCQQNPQKQQMYTFIFISKIS